MPGRTLAEWLRWQESLSPQTIDLGLGRVREVAARLDLAQPAGRTVIVGGTNGKGSTCWFLEGLLRSRGLRTGLYTSPHLLRYQERIRLDGEEVSEAALLAAFERVEAARGTVPLTYFEFGTLAAWVCFSAARCDAWVLEVGLGGRLDAVNAVDPDVSVITTVALDHQEWLGDSIEAIAAEKAGILRSGRPAFYGDSDPPRAILARAADESVPLQCFGRDFGFERSGETWNFRSRHGRIDGLPAMSCWAEPQYRNACTALAAAAEVAPGILDAGPDVAGILEQSRPPARFQRVRRRHEWILDVAHNPQAADTLHRQLAQLPPADTTVVTSLLSDKAAAEFAAALDLPAARWIVCPVDDPRSRTGERLVEELRRAGIRRVQAAVSPAEALAMAEQLTPAGGRIVVCGSFRIVAPGLEHLGLYCASTSDAIPDGPAAR